MTEQSPRETHIERPFRGKMRRFYLGIPQMQEVEKLTGFGIGEIAMRLSTHRYGSEEIYQTIRLALEGGGTSTVEATALLIPCQAEPVADFTDLATEIVAARLYGVAPAGEDDAPEAPASEAA